MVCFEYEVSKNTLTKKYALEVWYFPVGSVGYTNKIRLLSIFQIDFKHAYVETLFWTRQMLITTRGTYTNRRRLAQQIVQSYCPEIPDHLRKYSSINKEIEWQQWISSRMPSWRSTRVSTCRCWLSFCGSVIRSSRTPSCLRDQLDFHTSVMGLS